MKNEKEILDSVALLTSKPVIYACNMSEEDFAKAGARAFMIRHVFNIREGRRRKGIRHEEGHLCGRAGRRKEHLCGLVERNRDRRKIENIFSDCNIR